jgi:3-hydroxyisobutyrate dehydrogenase-like beta-hydroxyacid dehydrogenase
MRIAVLGLGAMGAAIARRLEAADAGFELVVWNRTDGPAAEFVQRGATSAASPAAAATAAEVVISMLADGSAVEAVLLGEQGALAGAAASPQPAIVIDMSTIDVAASERVAADAQERGVPYLRAPVSGHPGVVAAGTLTVLVSGDAGTFEAARGALGAIGPTLLYLGEGERARVVKLVLNLMVGGTMQLLAEALVLGEANGLEREQLLDAIAASVVGSPFVRYKAGPLAAGDYAATFSARGMRKDLRLVVDCAEGAGVPVPVAATVRERLEACVDAGMGEFDFAVLVPLLAREAGLADALPAG